MNLPLILLALAMFAVIVVGIGIIISTRQNRKDVKTLITPMLGITTALTNHLSEQKKEGHVIAKYLESGNKTVQAMYDIAESTNQLLHKQGARMFEMEKIIIRFDNTLKDHSEQLIEVKRRVKKLEPKPNYKEAEA